jgi:hypothetical protein
MANSRRKTSFEVDFEKVALAKELLGTTSLTETVDAAFDEIIAIAKRRDLLEILFEGDSLDLGDDTIMASAWR